MTRGVVTIVSLAPSLCAPSLSYSSPSTLLLADDPNDNYSFSQMVEAKKSIASGESDSAGSNSSCRWSEGGRDSDGGTKDIGSDNEDDSGAGIPELHHRELEKLIAEHLRKLRRKKTLLSDTKAASTAFDLEAMRRFNDIQLSLHIEIRKQKEQVANAPAYCRAIMKKKQKKIRPAI
ncbi:hypothetical protein BJV78DRAFT_1159326 [Lactifluus subvellereus]|nr:hypothetical protein BJV78DRAFT_1159326 [Lactifluus subvellereus]